MGMISYSNDVVEGDLIHGEVHPIPHGAEEGYREAEIHSVDHMEDLDARE